MIILIIIIINHDLLGFKFISCLKCSLLYAAMQQMKLTTCCSAIPSLETFHNGIRFVRLLKH